MNLFPDFTLIIEPLKLKDMINIDFLKTLYVERVVCGKRCGISGITAKEIVDGRFYKRNSDSVLQQKGLERCILLGFGKYASPNFYYAGCASLFGLRPGGMRHYCQEICYLEKVPFNSDGSAILDRCYSKIEEMYRIIVGNLNCAELSSMVVETTPVNLRRVGDFIGFGLNLYFVEDYDFSYER